MVFILNPLFKKKGMTFRVQNYICSEEKLGRGYVCRRGESRGDSMSVENLSCSWCQSCHRGIGKTRRGTTGCQMNRHITGSFCSVHSFCTTHGPEEV